MPVRLAPVELDDVVETAVVLPDFGVDDEPREPRERSISRWQGTVLRASSLVAVLMVSMAAAVLGSDRGTVLGPSTTVTETAVQHTSISFDPVHGVIKPGKQVVGKDVPLGTYMAVVDAQSTICEWTLSGTRAADARWKTHRGQRTDTTASVDLTVAGQVLESSGCHWRLRG